MYVCGWVHVFRNMYICIYIHTYTSVLCALGAPLHSIPLPVHTYIHTLYCATHIHTLYIHTYTRVLCALGAPLHSDHIYVYSYIHTYIHQCPMCLRCASSQRSTFIYIYSYIPTYIHTYTSVLCALGAPLHSIPLPVHPRVHGVRLGLDGSNN